MEEEYENIQLPHKKPRGGELTDEQKANNRAFSSDRTVTLNMPSAERSAIERRQTSA